MKVHMSRSERHWLLVVCLLFVCLLPAGASETFVASTAGSSIYVPNEYIIQATAGASAATVSQSVGLLGGTLVKALPLPDTYLVKMGTTGGGGVNSSRAISGGNVVASPWVIKSFTPNAIYKTTALPNDEYISKLWGMKSINMPQAWDVQKGSSSVTVAVIDTGTANHPDLAGRIVPGWDFIDNDADPSNDLIGHGTHVAGTIAAQGDNLIGVCGVCWDGVNIMPIRVFGTGGSTTDVIIQGMDYALQHRADVVNMSLGGAPGYQDPVEHAKVQEMAAAGMILCASAGNGGLDPDPGVGAPALYPECIAVASVGPTDEISYFSSYGPGFEVDIAAPGGDDRFGADPNGMILSTVVDNTGPTPGYGYGVMEGTSMACPHVAGAAALLLSAGVPASEVRQRLESSARKPKSGSMDKKKFGNGILDVSAALANGSVVIGKPIKGGTVSPYPDFKVNVRGIVPTSIGIYLDYLDTDGDGLPDNLAGEVPVISAQAASGFLNTARTAITFNWAQVSPGVPIDPGFHYLYVTAATEVGDAVSDWGTFSVASKIIPAGQHLFAFPYGFASTSPDGVVTMTKYPSDVLLDASTSQPLDFRLQTPDRARLIRWNAPQSYYVSYITGLLDPSQNTPRSDDRSWMNPIANMMLPTGTMQAVPTAGGYLGNDTSSLQFPASAGFWLILQKDAVLNSSIAEISAPQGFRIPLYKGWNLIGNPFTHNVFLSTVHLSYQGEMRTLSEDQSPTVRRPWVDPSFYGYSSGSGYDLVDDGLFEPYTGYWVKANVGGISPQETLYMIVQ